MAAGSRRHRISIDQPVQSTGTSGGRKKTFTPYTRLPEVWAEQKGLTSRERFLRSGGVVEYDLKYRIAYSPAAAAITTQHRVRHRGLLYDIVGVENIENKDKTIDLLCKVGPNEG